jgi:dTDP-4-dehydrorhamnose reductase
LRILVIGNAGQVARALRTAGEAMNLTLQSQGRPHLDLARPETVRAAIADFKPVIVVNAAAYTAVDAAEDRADDAFAINAKGSGDAAEIAAVARIPFIHISTDYVFDGMKKTPYREDDPTNPLCVYGKSKLAGEKAVAAANPHHVILRTSWVYDATGANFLRTMLRVAGKQPQLRVVDDQHGSPIFAADAASTILSIAKGLAQQETGRSWGVFHMAPAGETTWCGFAREIFAQSRQLGGPFAEVAAITTAEYPTRARRPANSRFDCSKLADVYGIRLPDWRDGLGRCMKELSGLNWGVG